MTRVNREHHDLPEGAIISAEVEVVGFIDPERDGELAYSVWHQGDSPLSTFVGLLEMAKLDVIEHAEDR